MRKPRVLVCQHGARRRYAVARILEEAGMLTALYTDSSAHSHLGKAAKLVAPIANGRVQRLLHRKIVGIPRKKIFSSDRPFLSDVRTSLLRRDKSILDTLQRRHRILSRRMIHWGLHDADIIYAQNTESYDFLYYAKDNGKIILVDVNLNPLSHRIMAAVALKYPGWGFERCQSSCEMVETFFKRSAALADILLCPSEWVAEGVRELTPAEAHKIRVCPYGSSIDYSGRINRSVNGRIFWAGGDWMRKGLHYLAQAADKLKQQYPKMDFRAAGVTDPQVINMARFNSINFLGKLNKKEMQEEFLTADMFVFPTLSEGMAGVVIEAITAGCPVITTKCAGINITSMVDGVLVPPGDAGALAKAIETLYLDRSLRAHLAANTRKLATEYTLMAWRKRLFAILNAIGI